MLPAVEAMGGEIVECVVLVDRSGGRTTLTSPTTGRVYPLRSLWQLDLPTYEPGPATCPRCADGTPLHAPGQHRDGPIGAGAAATEPLTRAAERGSRHPEPVPRSPSSSSSRLTGGGRVPARRQLADRIRTRRPARRGRSASSSRVDSDGLDRRQRLRPADHRPGTRSPSDRRRSRTAPSSRRATSSSTRRRRSRSASGTGPRAATGSRSGSRTRPS